MGMRRLARAIPRDFAMTLKIPTACAVAALAAAASLLTGCVVAPAYPAGPVYAAPAQVAAYAPPPGVAYVQPYYAMPAPGYAWRYQARYGWGWYSPRYGWYRR